MGDTVGNNDFLNLVTKGILGSRAENSVISFSSVFFSISSLSLVEYTDGLLDVNLVEQGDDIPIDFTEGVAHC